MSTIVEKVSELLDLIEECGYGADTPDVALIVNDPDKGVSLVGTPNIEAIEFMVSVSYAQLFTEGGEVPDAVH
jgi:hypothetical protein